LKSIIKYHVRYYDLAIATTVVTSQNGSGANIFTHEILWYRSNLCQLLFFFYGSRNNIQ